MTIIDDVQKLDRSTAAAVATFVVALIAPGALVVFYFMKGLFLTLDTTKLLLLSITFSAPSFFMPYFMMAIVNSVLVKRQWVSEGTLGSGVNWYYMNAINSSINLYLGVLLCYLFDFPFRSFVLFVVAATVISMISILFQGMRAIRKPEHHVPLNPL